MGILGDIGSFISDDVLGPIKNNASWLQPVANIALGIYGNQAQQSAQQNYINAIRQQEIDNFNNSKNQISGQFGLLNSMNDSQNAVAEGQAANIQDAIAQEQAAQAMFAPFIKEGLKYLPAAGKAYGSGLKGLDLLSSYINKPESLKKLALPDAIPLTNFLKNAA